MQVISARRFAALALIFVALGTSPYAVATPQLMRASLTSNPANQAVVVGRSNLLALRRPELQVSLPRGFGASGLGGAVKLRLLQRRTVSAAAQEGTVFRGFARGAGLANSALSLTQVGSAFYGTLRVGERTVVLRAESDTGRTKVEVLDPNDPASCGVESGSPARGNEGASAVATNYAALNLPAPGGSSTRIEVMFVYSKAARVAAGGHESVIATIMEAVYGPENGVDSILERSGIPVFIQPAGFFALPENEDEVGNPDSDLYQLALSSPGYTKWDSVVQPMREATHADLVQLVVARAVSSGGSNLCGTAFQRRATDNLADGYGLTKLSCTAARKTLAHELGHSLGAHHENAVGYFPFSRGFVFNVGGIEYGTIMAQNTVSRTRIPLYSSPDLQFAGAVAGSPDADNRTTITTVAPLVSFYRAPACPEDLNGDHRIDQADLGILIGNFGQSGAGDFDGDGVVTTNDLQKLLGKFGTVCRASE